MFIPPCHHPMPALPGALSRNQIVLLAVHGADDDAPPERLSARPRRLAAPYPAPFPLAGPLRRTCGASGPDSGKPADGQPRRPVARSTLGRRAWLSPLSANAIRLDINVGAGAGYHRSWAAGQPVLLPGPHRSRDTGRNQHDADGHRLGTQPSCLRQTETPHPQRAGLP